MHINISKEELELLHEYVNKTGIYIVAHGTYLDALFVNSSASHFIQKELDVCKLGNIKGFVLHLSDSSPEIVLERINKLNIPHGMTLYLETPALSPARARYHKASDIVQLMKHIRHKNIGIAIDLAHLHASGIDLASYEDAKKYFDEILEYIPSERILIHLNDDANAFASGKDYHELIFRGNVWKKYKHNKSKSGIALILKYIKKYNIKSIMEIEDAKLIRQNYAIIESI
jgi:endonuclease IV